MQVQHSALWSVLGWTVLSKKNLRRGRVQKCFGARTMAGQPAAEQQCTTGGGILRYGNDKEQQAMPQMYIVFNIAWMWGRHHLASFAQGRALRAGGQPDVSMTRGSGSRGGMQRRRASSGGWAQGTRAPSGQLWLTNGQVEGGVHVDAVCVGCGEGGLGAHGRACGAWRWRGTVPFGPCWHMRLSNMPMATKKQKKELAGPCSPGSHAADTAPQIRPLAGYNMWQLAAGLAWRGGMQHAAAASGHAGKGRKSIACWLSSLAFRHS